MTIYMHVVTLLLASTAALAAAVAVWAAESRRYWFWSGLAIWSCVAVMLPIRAYEPALVLAVSLPLMAVTVRAMMWRLENQGDVRSVWRSIPRLARFRLRDVALAMTVMGLSMVVLLHLRRHMTWEDDWLRAKSTGDVFIPAMSLAVLAVLSWYGVHGPRRLAAFVGLAVAVVACAEGLHRRADWLYALDDKFGIVAMVPNRDELAYSVGVVGFAEFSALVVLLLLAFSPSLGWPRLRRASGYAMLTALGTPLILIYCQMLTFISFPPGPELSPSERRILEI